jgi:ribosome biogenesis SPOUT family RNA methylase Rps3
MREPLIVVEHLEPELSEWLFAEYAHAAEITGGRLLITNVKLNNERRRLSRICEVRKESVAEIFMPRELLVLDPRARRRLRTEDMSRVSAAVIGGILGDDPPQGRTRRLLTEKLPGCIPRNIGRGQFSIDGSVYIVREVAAGRRLEDIQTVQDVEIPLEEGLSIILPFSYPVVGEKPLISERLVRYLRRKGARF